MKVVVVGGGPAGIIAALSAAQCGANVMLLEKNTSLGKKLLITGKGRCNITSSIDISDFIKNIPGNGRFLYSAFQNYTNLDIISLLEKNGVKVKEERGNRIFPVSDRAQDVLDALIKELKKYKNIEIRTNAKVKKILVDDSNFVSGVVLENNEKIMAGKVILATGGKSYPLTGSNGEGYEMAKVLGHSIENIRGSLVPITADSICQRMQGLSLKNVKITIKDDESQKKIYDDFGEMLFTHFGISGPVILSGSSHLLRYKDVERKFKEKNINLYIDLKPALSQEELDKRILRDFDEVKNKEFKNSLDKLLPKKMIDVVVDLSEINPYKKVNEITKDERLKLVNILKNFKVTLTGFRPVDEAIVTAGGISIKEINPKTMESKLVSGLFFAGEIIDVDAYTGGFNLQIAYSTGFTAGQNF